MALGATNITYECPYCVEDFPDLPLHFLSCTERAALKVRAKSIDKATEDVKITPKILKQARDNPYSRQRVYTLGE